jgi:uncharacterized repeat protein (TIGR02543 family)
MDEAEKSKTVLYNAAYGILPVPTRTGYVFDGWYNGSTKVTAATKVTTAANHTLTAKWNKEAPKTVTVTFEHQRSTTALLKKVRLG